MITEYNPYISNGEPLRHAAAKLFAINETSFAL